MISKPLKVVLDSNVLISLLVFADPRYPLLAAALKSGDLIALSDPDCAAEFQRVLTYAQVKLEPARQAAVYAAFLALTIQSARANGANPPLPKCKDADDQKFLELAFNAGASLLVTGDKALLALNRARYRLPFEIITALALERRLAAMGDAAAATRN